MQLGAKGSHNSHEKVRMLEFITFSLLNLAHTTNHKILGQEHTQNVTLWQKTDKQKPLSTFFPIESSFSFETS